LLYISGSVAIDALVEAHYQGEDVYVKLTQKPDGHELSIDDFSIYFVNQPINLPVRQAGQSANLTVSQSIKSFQLLYDEGLIVINSEVDSIILSFNFIINLELVSFLYHLNAPKEIPQFVIDRFSQLSNSSLFRLIDEHRLAMEPNDYIHFYNDIDELAYAGITDSFAQQAKSEVPLLYIKYIDTDTLEQGLLVTYNGIYTPDNYVPLSKVQSIRFNEGLGFNDTVDCYINGNYFSTLKLIIWDRSYSNFPFHNYSKVFPLDAVLRLISDISYFINKTNEQF
jgi:hypothetical protein